MTQEQKDKLIAAGRADLVETFEILHSGYAGVLGDGRIVDRRIHPKAIPMPGSSVFGTPDPKPLPAEK